MDAITEKIVLALQGMTEGEKQKVLALASYHYWRKHGGPKSDLVCHGEQIDKAITTRKQMTAYLCQAQPMTLAG